MAGGTELVVVVVVDELVVVVDDESVDVVVEEFSVYDEVYTAVVVELRTSADSMNR